MSSFTDRRCWLKKIKRSKSHLSTVYGIDDFQFETSYWYSDVDFYQLEETYGEEFMQRIYFHIVAFDVNKLISLHAKSIDWGVYERFNTARFAELWHLCATKIWGQWRYENDLPDYHGPVFVNESVSVGVVPIVVEAGDGEVLSFYGGGKDSLVSARMFEEAGISYSTISYSHSIYGQASFQHKLVDMTLDTLKPFQKHRLSCFDSFMDCPVLEYEDLGLPKPELIAGETPNMIFGVLPFILTCGYTSICIGNERSANVGNLIWDKTGEDINHQWGKSFDAEVALNTYIKDELIQNLTYFSILQPIYDTVIFQLARKQQDYIVLTNSCNIEKPWCCKCSKCCYVWLSFMAYLSDEVIDEMFHNRNLLDFEENQLFFKQMLGLDVHTPFECIGMIDESRLAFLLCLSKNRGGLAMEMFLKEVPQMDVSNILEKYMTVEETDILIPDNLKDRLLSLMKEAAATGHQYVRTQLKSLGENVKGNYNVPE